MASTLLHGATVADENTAAPRDIWIRGGRVRAVAPGLKERADADECIDLTGCLVVPGAIDPHAHFEEAAGLDLEDFGTGTRSAAAGGPTAVFSPPPRTPPPSPTQ